MECFNIELFKADLVSYIKSNDGYGAKLYLKLGVKNRMQLSRFRTGNFSSLKVHEFMSCCVAMDKPFFNYYK